MLLNIFEYHIINMYIEYCWNRTPQYWCWSWKFQPQDIALKPASNGTCMCVCIYNTLLIKIFDSIKLFIS